MKGGGRMKKVFSVFMLLITTLSLTSCKVNWFGDTLDVPWYYVAVPVFLIFLLAYINLMSKTYVCPHCKAEFKVKPYQLSVTVHSFGKRLAKCPNCGIRGFCYVKK